jgi:hypothetical protein
LFVETSAENNKPTGGVNESSGEKQPGLREWQERTEEGLEIFTYHQIWMR